MNFIRYKILFIEADVVYHLHTIFANVCHKLAVKHTQLYCNINKLCKGLENE